MPFSTAVRSVRVDRSAGDNPKITALTRAAPKLTSSTRRSRSNDAAIGSSVGNTDLTEQRDARVGDPEAGDAAERRNQQALGDELPDDAAAAGADGQPHGDFASPRRTAAGQEARDVRARHQQHGAGERDQHGRQRRDRRRLRDARAQLGAEDQPPIAIGLGIGALEIGGNRRQLALCLR